MAASWHLVLGRDGTVLAATDGAPASWIGRRILHCNDAPTELKTAVDAILARTARMGAPITDHVSIASSTPPVGITIVDALPLRRGPTDIRALLCSALQPLVQQAKAADITLTITIDPAMPGKVVIDADKIAWATTALVGNALRFVRRGSFSMPSGSIAVRAIYDPAGPDLTIEVQDDGPGIAHDQVGLLFNPVANRPRIGLGLLIVQEVVAAHGGHVDVHSETKPFLSGTTIRLTLPVW